MMTMDSNVSVADSSSPSGVDIVTRVTQQGGAQHHKHDSQNDSKNGRTYLVDNANPQDGTKIPGTAKASALL